MLTSLQSRLTSGSTDLATDPTDPDLQLINSLKEKISTTQAEIEAGKNSLGANNPKMVSAAANLATVRKQLADATDKSREHLKDKIAATQSQIASLEVAQAQAQKTLIAAQAQRDRLGDLQRDVVFKLDELNARERAAAQARLQSKLTFADIAVLDKAEPPIAPAFPKPLLVMPVAIGGGLALGMILALLAEATDRRVRFPADFGNATSAPLLGRHRGLDKARGGFAAGGRRGACCPRAEFLRARGPPSSDRAPETRRLPLRPQGVAGVGVSAPRDRRRSQGGGDRGAASRYDRRVSIWPVAVDQAAASGGPRQGVRLMCGVCGCGQAEVAVGKAQGRRRASRPRAGCLHDHGDGTGPARPPARASRPPSTTRIPATWRGACSRA